MARVQQTIPLELSEKPEIDVRVQAERIRVFPIEPGGLARIEVSMRRGAEVAPIELSRDGDRLIIAGTKNPSAWPWPGAGMVNQLVLYVPQHIRARIKQDFGQLFIERLAGCDLDLSASAGTIALTDVHGRLTVSVDSGTVSGEHLGGTIDVHSQAGSVKLGIDALDAGEHRVRTAMGSVKVFLAPSVKVKMEANTTLGSTRVTHPNSPDADAVMRLDAELGSIRVKTGADAEDRRHGDWPDWRRLWRDFAKQAVAVAIDEIPRALPSNARVPDEELRKVLELVESGKLTAPDAERLIRAMGR